MDGEDEELFVGVPAGDGREDESNAADEADRQLPRRSERIRRLRLFTLWE